LFNIKNWERGMADISFNCPFCNQHYEAPEEMAGQTLECQNCKKEITVPRLNIILKTSTPKNIQPVKPSPKIQKRLYHATFNAR
jgi:hypothetical protein